MKLELKTENENNLKSFSHFFIIALVSALLIILCDLSLKFGMLSKHYQIEFNCKMLTVKKSPPNIKKLSRLSNLKNKQRILEFCREYVK
tara:strand:- start:106 stop:372 length:267 start_codon:yes stop_codon:yes gene_type:complete